MRGHIRTVLEFLTWLHARSRTIATVDQRDIDAWLTNGPSSRRRYRIRQFLAWSRRRDGVPDLTVPPDPPSEPQLRLLDADTIARQLRRCLHDADLPLDVRVAGALVILYGLRISRLVHLTVDDVTRDGGGVHLHAGRAPIRIPPPVDDLLTDLAAAPADPSPLSRAVGTSRHLFPGVAAGRPMRPTAMHRRLRRHHIDGEPGRHTALLALAADMPAPILADLLGIHVNTVLRWSEHAGGDWIPYLNARDNPD
ncbi:MAG: hypothetical protein ACRDT4_22120 [Micromonosporaceae bacterium]